MPTPDTPSDTAALAAALRALAGGFDLDEAMAAAAFDALMTGGAAPTLVAQLLAGLRDKGETAAEIAGAARALRKSMIPVHHPDPASLVDTCGTGGGRVRTVNISTAAAFVVAGSGVAVAKHGNRSFTSLSGSADVLEALGIRLDVGPERAAHILDEVGLVFLFAPTFHPAMRHVAPVRRELGTTTIMNLVGPLANPAGVGRQVVGVANPALGARMAEALLRLGARHAMVVHGDAGIDEISPIGLTRVWEVNEGGVTDWWIDPAQLGLAAESLEGLEGGTAEHNAGMLSDLFQRPERAPSALRAAVLLNAAAAIRVARSTLTMAEAVEVARTSLDGGAAAGRLAALRLATAAVNTS